MSAHRLRRPSFVILAIAVLATACGSLPEPKLVGGPTALHYEGQLLPSGCEPAYQGRARIVADIVCGRVGHDRKSVGELYGAMDLANPEAFDVAVLLIACVEAGQCSGPSRNPTRLADFHHFAVTFDPRALARTLTALPLDAELRTLFSRRAEACRADVIAQVASMPPRWAAVFLEPLEAARVRTQTLAVVSSDQEKTLARLTARVDAALLAKKPDPALAGEIDGLRRANARACMELGHALSFCLAATRLGRTLTRLQGQLAILAGDRAAAAAERALLVGVARAGGDRGELRRAMAESLERERAKEKELDAARGRGVQEAAITRTRGGAPIIEGDFDNLAGASAGGDDAPDLAIDTGALTDLEAQVDGVGRRGELADVSFRREMQENSEGYGCYETHKIVQISERGEVIYETQCAGYKTSYENRGAARVTVPWTEVRHLRPGMIAYVVVDTKTRAGHVIGIRAGTPKPFDHRSSGEAIDTYLELRGFERVAPSSKPPAIAMTMTAALAAEVAGDWAAAAGRLEAAFAAHPYPPLLLGVAHALEAQGDLAGAADAYGRYLALGADLPRAASARTAVDELQAQISGRGAAAAPPLPALARYGVMSGLDVGGGSTDRNGGIATLRLWSGVTALDQHVEADAFAETSGGDVGGMFGIDARGYALTGIVRPYVLGAVGIGKYSSNTSRPVRSAELGGGVALLYTVGRRVTMGLKAELVHRWTSIGSDPIFPQIMADSDEATLFRVGFVVGFRSSR